MASSASRAKCTNKAVIAFGSNLGDRIANIEGALAKLKARNINILKLSSLYETKPMYYDDQDTFLNGVCQVETDLDPLPLLDILQSVENDLGRSRLIDKGPRTIDLDIVLYNHEHIKHERLNVPHALMLEREFVLRPLADILPDEHLPSSFHHTAPQRSVKDLLNALPEKDATMSTIATMTPNMPLVRVQDSSRRTQIMAILNLTPDSFSDGGLHDIKSIESVSRTVQDLVSAGADIIDVGGQSTRPRADFLTAGEELDRVLPVIRAIRDFSDVPISIDTFHSEVARQTALVGADIVNDISAGLLDDHMLSTVAELGKTIILMHMRGNPHTMTNLTDYPDGVVEGVARELSERIEAALTAGIPPWRIVLDPGLGFAKNQEQNLELLRGLQQLREHPQLRNYAWLSGPSRKGFVGKITEVPDASKRSYGTAAAVTASIAGGADIVRVHDVAEMLQVSRMADAIYRCP